MIISSSILKKTLIKDITAIKHFFSIKFEEKNKIYYFNKSNNHK